MTAEQRPSSQSASFHETLRRLAMIDEAFVGERAGIVLYPAAPLALDAKTTALLQLAVSVAIGSSAACVEWSTARAVTAGVSDDEIADVLAIAPVAGLGQVVWAAPDIAAALGYDIAAALETPDDK
jgi:AhpD family alkylhydroperoxidase